MHVAFGENVNNDMWFVIE